MKSLRLNLAMVAAALLAAPVAANAQALDVFTFGGVNPNAPLGTPTARVGPYFGTLDNFQNDDGLVWCVDLIGNAESINPVWVTGMGNWDFSKTERGAAYKNNYRWAAFFASYMPTEYAAGPEDTDLFAQRSQQVIWELMGYDTPTSTAVLNTWINTNFGAAAGNILTAAEIAAIQASITGGGSPIAIAPVISSSFDYRKWVIITDANCSQAGIRAGTCNPDTQELIARVPNPPQETVPEPATMTLLATGLAGMAAARRRRKQA
jgi:hypothetical protein